MTETTIKLDISDENFMRLAQKAHEKNITLNELCKQMLRDCTDGKIQLAPEDDEQRQILDKLRHATTDVVEKGVSVESLRDFGYAFLDWNMTYHGSVGVNEIIKQGVDNANLR